MYISDKLQRISLVKMRGIGLVKSLALIPVVLIVILLLVIGFYEGRKAYWDYRVDEMCEEDGGAYIFEQTQLTAIEAKTAGLITNGSLVIPLLRKNRKKPEYFITYESTDIHAGTPEVFRGITRVVRGRDEKVIAKMVNYSRVGGDFPTYAHPSSKGCKDEASSLLKFRGAILVEDMNND